MPVLVARRDPASVGNLRLRGFCEQAVRCALRHEFQGWASYWFPRHPLHLGIAELVAFLRGAWCSWIAVVSVGQWFEHLPRCAGSFPCSTRATAALPHLECVMIATELSEMAVFCAPIVDRWPRKVHLVSHRESRLQPGRVKCPREHDAALCTRRGLQ